MWLPETEQVIFELQSHGIVPIIAHPERYSTLQKDPVTTRSVDTTRRVDPVNGEQCTWYAWKHSAPCCRDICEARLHSLYCVRCTWNAHTATTYYAKSTTARKACWTGTCATDDRAVAVHYYKNELRTSQARYDESGRGAEKKHFLHFLRSR